MLLICLCVLIESILKSKMAIGYVVQCYVVQLGSFSGAGRERNARPDVADDLGTVMICFHILDLVYNLIN